MQNLPAYYKELLAGYICNSISPEQVKELYAFIDREPATYEQWMREPKMLQLVEENAGAAEELSADADLRISTFLGKYTESSLQPAQHYSRSARLIHLFGGARKWWAAAAILLIGISVAILITTDRQNNTPASGLQNVSGNDALPGKKGAILTLADGRKVLLDSLDNGVVTTQGKTTVQIINGKLVYNAIAKDNEIIYNTMTTPNGRQYELVLPDGTGVWLNAASLSRILRHLQGTIERSLLRGKPILK